MKHLLPIIALTLTACTGSTHQTHMRVADTISRAVNETVPAIKTQYAVDLRTCRTTALTLPDYHLCASQVDERWSHFRDVWFHMRNVQADYAKALETKEPSLPDYAEWVEMAYCQLKSVAPESLKLPAVPGLRCKDE